MSVYTIHKLCRRTLHDPAFREAVKLDPARAIEAWPLTDAERQALLAGDVAQLYSWGAHGYLLAYFVRWGLFGLTEDVYSERMRACQDHKPRI